jgi:hypothetical protein
MGKEDRYDRSTSTYRGTWGRHTLQTDRRTRDRVRLFFWAVLTVVCLVAVVVARQQQEQGLQRKINAAQERAVRFTQNVLADRLDAKRVSRPIGRSGYDELMTELKHGLFNDQRVVRVRVWRGDGILVFTSDHPAEIGNVTADDAGVDLGPAMRGDLTGIVVTEPFARDDATTPEPTTLLSTFVPLRSTDKADVFGAVEIDNDYSLMVDATEHPWKQVQVAFAILALICLLMAIVSLVWSHRAVTAEVDGSGPSRREARATAKDEKKAAAAEAEVAKLRERVKELEGKTKAHSEQQAELEKLRDRVAEFESGPAPAAAAEADPAEMAQLKAHATQLEEQARGAESRVTQLQSRVTEMEAQLRVTTDQLRMAQQRAEETQASASAADVSPEIVAQIEEQLAAAAEVEQVLRDELEASRAEAQRVQQELEQMELAHSEEARSQQGQLDQVRAQARLAEEERQRILAEAAKSPTAQEAMSADAESRIKELTQQLERSEAERAMLRAGRPETVYEARNRQLEDEIAALRERPDGAQTHGAPPASVDPGAIASLEERLAAAEARAREAERRLDEAAAKPRSRSRASRRANAAAEANGNGKGNGEVDVPQPEPEISVQPDDEAQEPVTPVEEGPPVPTVDGSELRSRLVRSTDARRRGISTPTPTPTPGPKRR